MVKSASEAAENFEKGIRDVGISAWKDAAGKTTPKAAAETLHSAKVTELSVSDMKSNYKDAYA